MMREDISTSVKLKKNSAEEMYADRFSLVLLEKISLIQFVSMMSVLAAQNQFSLRRSFEREFFSTKYAREKVQVFSKPSNFILTFN